jgi:hypothetical protein
VQNNQHQAQEAATQAHNSAGEASNAAHQAQSSAQEAASAAAHASSMMSRRAVKRDIRYVTDAEADRLAAEAVATRLATYEYINTARPEQRLGFIIDDEPSRFAIATDGNHVDVYGYASLLLATAQSHERRLRALETRRRARKSRSESR